MHILHTRNGTGAEIKLLPNWTLFVFDESELPLVERIVQDFVDMYDEDHLDPFYYKLVDILEQVRVSHTQEEVQ